MHGRGQSFATTHGTAPMCFGSMHPEPLLAYGLARAVVTSESSIVTLCMADGIIINLFGTLHILWLLGLLPELHGQHIRIHYRTGLCPGIEPLKPVVVLHILRHTILDVDGETLLCFIHPSALASQLGIAQQSATSSQRGMSLGLDTCKVHLQESIEENLDRFLQILITQYGIGVDKTLHTDKHTTHIGGEHPSVLRSNNISRLCTLALHPILWTYGIAGKLFGERKEEIAGDAAYHLPHPFILLPEIILTEGTQHPSIARQLLFVSHRMNGSHISLLIQMCGHPAYDFLQVTGCAM